MTVRDDKIYEEAIALWRELYSEPPPLDLSGRMILDRIMGNLTESRYVRFSSAHLRPTNVAFPRRAAD